MASDSMRGLEQTAFCSSPLPLRKRSTFLSCNLCIIPITRATQSSTTISASHVPQSFPRRQLLSLGVALAGVSLLPGNALALNKKRIVAKAGPPVDLPNGVSYRDITVGKGYTPRNGDSVAIHYSLFYKDLEVESSRESQGLAATPIGFTYGATSGPGSVMLGVNIGMEGMKVGGLRLISVPPQYAYGEKGRLPLIPGNATVDFAVSLLSVKRSGTNPISVIDPKAQVF